MSTGRRFERSGPSSSSPQPPPSDRVSRGPRARNSAHMKSERQRDGRHHGATGKSTSLFLLFIIATSATHQLARSQDNQQPQQQQQPHEQQQQQVPSPIRSASYISLDGLTLVIIFNKPVNLSASIESVEQRQAAAQAAAYESATEETAAAPASRANRPARLQAAASTTGGGSQTLGAIGQQNEATTGRRRAHSRRQAVTFSRAREPRQAQTNSHATSSKLDFLQVAGSSATPHASGLAGGRSKMARQAAHLCRDLAEEAANLQETPQIVAGVQLCAKLLTRKTLKLLHKYRLHNCLWASEVQFIIQLNRPIGGGGGVNEQVTPAASQQQQPVRIAFRRSTLSEFSPDRQPGRSNDQEVSVELNKLALEGLGMPLTPRLALTGPNQVPPCGQFSISAHLSSPYGTHPNESVRLQWSVERLGLIAATTSTTGNSSAPNRLVVGPNTAAGVPPHTATSNLNQAELAELQWQTLKQLVASQSGNNLVLDAQLMQFVPQLYEFRLSVTFTTSLTSFVLNATHQVGRLDFDAPIGTIYGTHLLAHEQQLNANSQLALMADIQVPACAQNIKQVGLYWQVSDPRVRFEQTYAPVYLAKSGALPEQAHIEFRLNLFYGIRVKKFASASTVVPVGESVLDAQISDGLLMASVGQPQDLISSSNDQSSSSSNSNSNNNNQLVLYAISQTQDQSQQQQQDKYTYQWTCFDGKTAQPCYKSLKLQASSGGTRYDVGASSGQQSALARPQESQAAGLGGGGPQTAQANSASSSNLLLLVDRTRQRQPILRLPLSWFESDAQLWFGLQRFDRQNPSQHSKTEYALISVHPLPPVAGSERADNNQDQPMAPQVSIGPLLIGRARQRATIRNPLTGAMVLVANAPAVIVGRLSPSELVGSFAWRLPNYLHPLHWTTKNVTNALSQREEILTELHLNQELLLAYGQHQVQLVVCARHTGARSTATISLDVVQGVSQCRVELASRPPDGLPGGQAANFNVQKQAAASLPIVITVNYCNIPLGLSPLTYQLYIIDTSASDGLIESSRQQQQAGGGGKPPSGEPQEDDYINEADELFYEGLAQPLSGPQLSPVFILAGLNAFSLMAIMQAQPVGTSNPSSAQQQPGQTRVRFGARVCDRLQSCRMFYSSSIDPLVLMAGQQAEPTSATDGANRSSSSSSPRQSERLEVVGSRRQQLRVMRQHAIDMLRGMLEAAKRANTAGNSIAAISILNALMTLGQRMLPQARTSPQAPATTTTTTTTITTPSISSSGKLKAGASETTSGVSYSNEADERDDDSDQGGHLGVADQPDPRVRDLLQVAMRDCLQYGAQSSQRQFHYTESGQTNLALAAMSRILASPQASFELKFRSLRLIVLLIRKSIDNQLASQLRLQSLPDLKTMQLAYESLFGAFTQHSTETFAGPASTGQDHHHHHHVHRAKRLAEAEEEQGAPPLRRRDAQRQQQQQHEDLKAPNQLDDNKMLSKLSVSRDTSNSSSSSISASQQLLRLEADGGARTLRERHQRHQPESAASQAEVSEAAAAASTSGAVVASAASSATLTTIQAPHHSTSLRANRRNKEEAVLAYLRLVRQAHRGLIQSIAMQLPLGAVQQFEYQSAGSPGLASSANTNNLNSNNLNSNNNNNNVAAAANRFIAAPQPAAYIVSSLTHQTDLISDTIDVDLRDFGSISVSFGEPANDNTLAKLGRQMRQSRMRCRNDTQTKCSSFVLALTSFAGKAPFRSLDLASHARVAPRLSVPIIQLDWLSPVDGSNLVELLPTSTRASGAEEQLTASDFRATVTFTLPQQQQQTPTARNATSGDESLNVAEGNPSQAAAAPSYKCYRFNEAANEWVALSVASDERVSLDEQSGSGSSGEPMRRLRCSFDGFGVVGVFQGKPPPVETSTELSIALGVACVLALVAIVSLLGCMASKTKAKQHGNHHQPSLDASTDSSKASGASSSSYDSDQDEHDNARQQRTRRPAHLEQTMAFR